MRAWATHVNSAAAVTAPGAACLVQVQTLKPEVTQAATSPLLLSIALETHVTCQCLTFVRGCKLLAPSPQALDLRSKA
jgi:hypothetical protein